MIVGRLQPRIFPPRSILIGVPLSPQGIIAQRHIELENSLVLAFVFQKAVLARPGQPAPQWCADCLYVFFGCLRSLHDSVLVRVRTKASQGRL